MTTKRDLALSLLRMSRQMLLNNVGAVTIDEALQSAGGYRSILGLLKHAAGWSHVYYSYAFDEQPRHWVGVGWPRGLRDTVDPSAEYLDEVRAWLAQSCDAWVAAIEGAADAQLDEQRRCHWGGTAPLSDIVVMVTTHWMYHAGEINAVLASARGEAWEYTEEVEENHISTAGHRLRPDWMSDEQAARYEAYIAARDAQLHGRGDA
jgi:hypothetical protein